MGNRTVSPGTIDDVHEKTAGPAAAEQHGNERLENGPCSLRRSESAHGSIREGQRVRIEDVEA